MKRSFKDIARYKQTQYFKEKYGIERFSTVKRKPKGCIETKDYYVEALLEKNDAKDGKIFYEGYRKQIMNEIDTLRKMGIYTPTGMMLRHTLRSEHIPWNVFFPMSLSDKKKNQANNIFNMIIRNVSSELPKIKDILSIKIEYAPKDKLATKESFTKCYLNDKTSFDTYIEYLAEDGEKGGIGIEVKYTEKGYLPGDTEKKAAITDYRKYRYYDVMLKSSYYTSAAFNPVVKGKTELWSPLVSNELRQIWRNHLLGASMVQHGDIKHFLSIHLYPQGNIHFHGTQTHKGAVECYKDLLGHEGKKTWTSITFEELFQMLQDNYTDKEGRDWVNYLKERYLF